jgi:hypothetical protein
MMLKKCFGGKRLKIIHHQFHKISGLEKYNCNIYRFQVEQEGHPALAIINADLKRLETRFQYSHLFL